MSENQNSRTYAIVVTILLLLAAGLGFFFWQKSKNYLAETEKLEKERVTLSCAPSSHGKIRGAFCFVVAGKDEL